jgi:hypothetical protein
VLGRGAIFLWDVGNCKHAITHSVGDVMANSELEIKCIHRAESDAKQALERAELGTTCLGVGHEGGLKRPDSSQSIVCSAWSRKLAYLIWDILYPFTLFSRKRATAVPGACG